MQDNFYLPFMGQKTIDLAFIIQDCLKEYSDYVKYNNPTVIGLYGSFNNIIWNGGRIITTNEFQTFEEVKQCLKTINNHDLKCKLTFTNQLLTENHCYDKYCNQILDLIADTENEIIIHSQILEDYILNKYPTIPLTSSITKGFDLNTFKTALHQNYKNVVCFYKQGILKYLETQPVELQNKVELMLHSDDCAYCKMYHQHYECESYYNLYNKYKNENYCYHFSKNYNKQTEWFNLPLEERLYFDLNYFNWLNIHTYKIQGRSFSLDELINAYLWIFFYPEIHEEVYNKIKNTIEI